VVDAHAGARLERAAGDDVQLPVKPGAGERGEQVLAALALKLAAHEQDPPRRVRLGRRRGGQTRAGMQDHDAVRIDAVLVDQRAAHPVGPGDDPVRRPEGAPDDRCLGRLHPVGVGVVTVGGADAIELPGCGVGGVSVGTRRMKPTDASDAVWVWMSAESSGDARSSRTRVRRLARSDQLLRIGGTRSTRPL
jgi:hypothetical protein